jgi:hypothetical protein
VRAHKEQNFNAVFKAFQSLSKPMRFLAHRGIKKRAATSIRKIEIDKFPYPDQRCIKVQTTSKSKQWTPIQTLFHTITFLNYY